MRHLLLTLFCATVPAAAAAAGATMAADTGYPSKPVRFISPFSAGGGTDTVARTLAARLGDQMNRPFVVDNRGGAEGVVGTEIGAKAPADGYTLLVANVGTFSQTPNLRHVSYDPLHDFAPVTQTTASSTVLAVSPTLPVRDLKAFVALVKARPGAYNYGAGSNAQALPMEMFKLMAGIDLKAVPYKGTGPTLVAVMGGEVIAFFGGSINTTPHVKAGRLRALAVAGDHRAHALPDTPTIAEAGYPGYEANSWNGIVAPAGTPRAIIDKLNAAMVKILQSSEVRNFMIGDGAEPAPDTPDEFTAFIRADYTKWARVIKAAGLKDSQ